MLGPSEASRIAGNNQASGHEINKVIMGTLVEFTRKKNERTLTVRRFNPKTDGQFRDFTLERRLAKATAKRAKKARVDDDDYSGGD